MKRGWASGAGVILAVHAAWFGLIHFESRADWFMGAIVVMLFVVMNVAGLGAFVTALTATRRGFLLGLSHAPLTALLATLSNLLLAATGTNVDFSGYRGNAGLFAISIAYGLFVCVIGGGIGLWMKRRSDTSTRPAITPSAGSSRPVEPYISDPAAPSGPAPPAGHI